MNDEARPRPKYSLLVMCVECGEGAEVPLPVDPRGLEHFLAPRGWFISMLSPPSPPNQGLAAPMVIGPLCAACAQQVLPPELFAAAEQRRQQLLQDAANEQNTIG